MSTLAVNTITDANGGSNTLINGVVSAPGGMMFRNRIINGDMRIDQRNAGASVTNGYAVDRFEFQENSGSAYTIQRSTTAPAGFTNSVLVTVTAAASATAAQVNRILQRIEGNNIADLGFGTASASTVTLSFWVRSSLTGTYCASLVNNAANRAYVAEYSVSTADTWEYKTITIAGDTTGTWETGTSSGIQVTFDLGSGSDYNATAGSWVAANDFRTTNQANFANTNGATWYITGVQLEVGSVATPFERRPYVTELALCQRYYENNFPLGVAVSASVQYFWYTNVTSYSATAARTNWVAYAVPKRSNSCTITFYRTNVVETNDNSLALYNGSAWYNTSTATTAYGNQNGFYGQVTGSGMALGQSFICIGAWTSSAEL